MGRDTAAVKGSRSFVLFIFRFGKQNAANAVKVTYWPLDAKMSRCYTL